MLPATLHLDRAAAEAFLLGRINYERDAGVPYRERNFKLDRMHELLARLGDPHLAAPAVHVAGTKGKGSTCSMIAAVITAAGYRTGLYTSPHFDRIEERMSIGGEICPPGEFDDLVRLLQPHVEAMDRAAALADEPEIGPTYFEVTTALAFLFFARRRVDVMVLEVGLGGRLDSTNVCRPTVTAITSISFDHTRQLGTTLAAIAREKAGIVKPGVPLVCGEVDDEPREAIHAIAAERGAKVWQLCATACLATTDIPPRTNLDREASSARGGHCLIGDGAFADRMVAGADQAVARSFSFVYEPNGPRMSYVEGTAQYNDLALGLVGRHQAANAAVAIAVVRRMIEAGWKIAESDLRAGLAGCRCPGRVEVLRSRPTVILDTAHNHASIEALLATLDESFPARRRTVIFSCSRDKDYRAMLSLLLAGCDRLILTRFANSQRSVEVEQLAAAAREIVAEHRSDGAVTRASVDVVESSATAWRMAVEDALPEDLICITGSFFLAAEMRPLVVGQASSLPEAE